jgi:trk system potassium uptake protein TrkA
MASPKQANEFFDKIEYKGNSIKNAVIVGGGSITHYLCSILERSKILLKIIEKDLEVCEQLSNEWEKITVVHGDGLNKELLLEEGIENTDAFVSLLNHDEDNILLSLFCKDVGKCKLVTKIKRTDYDQILAKLDMDAVICPKNITSDIILRYVRSTQNTQGINIERLYNIIQDKVEAAEFIIKEDYPVVDIPLSKLPLKKNVLVASITRGDTVIIPRGWDKILPGDAVVFISSDLALRDIADVLEE